MTIDHKLNIKES